jgi:cytochrome c peroxidase
MSGDLLKRQASKMRRFVLNAFALSLLAVGGALTGASLRAQTTGLSIKELRVPEPSNLGEFVRDRQAAIVLGKALFWDMQVGSDGIVACATCHFNAGADSRSRNQHSPGMRRVNGEYLPWPDTTFDRGPNWQLTRADFPLRLMANPDNRGSAVLRDSNDVIGSQGVFFSEFRDIELQQAEEKTMSAADPDGFRTGNLNVRRVEPRNTPTVINAVLNSRNFWDGRAASSFNGVNHLGAADTSARVYRAGAADSLTPVQVLIDNASLASQAVAPPLNATEMSAQGRTFADIFDKFAASNKSKGKKLRALRPLAKQLVHPEDSVLGRFSRAPEAGLTISTYADLIRAAFQPLWWQSELGIEIDKNGTHSVSAKNPNKKNVYTQMEYNFALFFGLAIQMYEATLVSDDSLFDRAMANPPTAWLTAEQKHGLALFSDTIRVRCINCHAGPALTDAAVDRIAAGTPFRLREGQWIDRGFNNIGLRPTAEDVGVGGRNELGQWLALTRRAGLTNVAVDGAFKTPGLRNVELTAPYFHNGSELTLRGVIEFYNRSGNFVPIQAREGTITGLHEGMNLNEPEKQALVAFLLSLTDERVRFQRAPFDHPQLFVPDGHVVSGAKLLEGDKGQAKDSFMEIPAVGSSGGSPLPKFLE